MIWLEVADLVIIASRTLKLDTDRVLALLDPSAAEAALGQARSGAEDDEPATQAARLLHALVDQRPLRRGNQQVALAAMLQLLALNGWEVDPDPAEATRAVVAELAAGTLDTSGVAVWLAPRLRPLGHAVTCAKEASMRRWRPLVAMSMGMATMRRQPKGMFQRFTDRARRAVHLAQEEARLLRHNYVGTEHLLLGLLYEGEGVAAKALGSLGISLERVRAQVEEIIGRGQTIPSGHIPFTPRAKKVLELSLREALQLGHSYIGTEHILLGLIREGEGPAAQVLARLGADLNPVRQQVIQLLHGYQGDGEPGTAPAAGRSGKAGRSKRKLLSQLLTRFDSVESRLSALEHRVGTGPDMRDLDQEIAQVRRDKESAIDAQDFEHAAALRDREKQLLHEKASRQKEWATAHMDLPSLSDEVERLRDLLRQHGIDPQDGVA